MQIKEKITVDEEINNYEFEREFHYKVVKDYTEINGGQDGGNLRETEKSFGNISLEF